MLPWVASLVPPAYADEVVVIEEVRPERPPAERRTDAEDVARTGAASISAVLDDDVAFYVRSGSRGEGLFTFRGFEQRQLAVFIDGVPASVPYDGQLDLGKFPSSLVESIVVTPGAAAGLLGPSGLGGAVRIRTRRPPPVPLAVGKLAATANGGLDAFVWGGAPVGPVRVGLALGGQSSPGSPLPGDWPATDEEDGGIRDDAASRSQYGQVRGEADLGRAGTLRGGINALSGSFDVPTGLDQDHPRYWRFSEFGDLGASVGWSSPADIPVGGEVTVFHAANRNVLDSYDDATRTTQTTPDGWHSTYDDARWGGAAGLIAQLASWLRGRAWIFADHQTHSSQADVGEPFETVGTTIASGALAAEASAGAWRMFAGGEVDGEAPSGEATFSTAPLSFAPSLGVGLDTDGVDVTAGVARRSRAPTLKERFSSAFGARVANLDLGPEHAWEASVDARLRPVEAIEVRASVHGAEVEDLIDEVSVGDGADQLQNVGRARLAGAEASAWLRFDRINVGAACGALYVRRLDAGPPDDRLEYLPSWQARAEAAVRPLDRVEVWVAADGVGPQWYHDDDTLGWGKLGAAVRFDAAIAFRPWEDARVRVRVRNLLDTTSWSALGFPNPGREVRVEVEIWSFG